MSLAKRMARLGTETAFEVLARARALEAQGRDVIHLEIGEPDFDTPRNIVEAGAAALRSGWTHYTPANGLPETRAAIAESAGRQRGVEVSADEVVVLPGGKPVIFFALLALADAGDEVIYPNPGFPIYESMIRFVGATPVSCPIRESNGFALDPDDVCSRLTKRTRMVILNSPANPTGGVTGRAALQQILAALRERPDVWILSDEIYGRLLYDGEENASPLSDSTLRDRVIVLDGFSKTYAMTGWRLGYGIMHPDLAAAVTKLMINSNSCTAAFSQRAGIEALRGDQSGAERMHEEFDRRRRLVVGLLNEVPGFRCHMPKGSFYVFPNVTGTGLRSEELARRLLEQGGVACLSGTAFGSEGEGYLRFSYAASAEKIREGVRRVRQVVESL